MVAPTERHISGFSVSYMLITFSYNLLITFPCNVLKAFIYMCNLDNQPNADYKCNILSISNMNNLLITNLIYPLPEYFDYHYK